MHQILKFCSRYLPKNDTFCHIFLDSTLFHQFLAVSVPNIVNVGHFTLIEVRRNSGELKNMPFLVGQNYHLRIAKTQGSSGWNYSAPPMTHREAQNVPKTFNRDKIHQYKAFWSTLEPFIHPWESQNDHFIPKKESCALSENNKSSKRVWISDSSFVSEKIIRISFIQTSIL